MPPPNVLLVTGSMLEVQARDWLRQLFADHDLRKWQFTNTVRIEEDSVSHSHPILTLNTRAPDPAILLATYLHEQIHWFSLIPENAIGMRQVAQVWRTRYPNVPIVVPEGCGTEFSNYLHFTVCFFEYSGVRELLGEAKAQRIMEYKIERPFYRFIYRTVLCDDKEMREIVQSCGLSL